MTYCSHSLPFHMNHPIPTPIYSGPIYAILIPIFPTSPLKFPCFPFSLLAITNLEYMQCHTFETKVTNQHYSSSFFINIISYYLSLVGQLSITLFIVHLSLHVVMHVNIPIPISSHKSTPIPIPTNIFTAILYQRTC